MNQHGFQFRARLERSWSDRSMHLWIVKDVFKPGKNAECQWLKMDKYEATETGVYAMPPPSVSGPDSEMCAMIQQIVDAAWAEGIRPRQITSMTAENQAQAQHLQDMRAIVGTKLNVALKIG